MSCALGKFILTRYISKNSPVSETRSKEFERNVKLITRICGNCENDAEKQCCKNKIEYRSGNASYL